MAVASTLGGTLSPMLAHAQPRADRLQHDPHFRGRFPRAARHAHPSFSSQQRAPDFLMGSGVPPDLDQGRRDGHMTPEERRLLRQHIEDAVRELYRR